MSVTPAQPRVLNPMLLKINSKLGRIIFLIGGFLAWATAAMIVLGELVSDLWPNNHCAELGIAGSERSILTGCIV